MEKTKTVGIITFHASHNYGSMLQAYALQHVVDSLGYQSEIINFRTDRQKLMYTPEFLKGNIRERLKKAIVQFPNIISILKRYSTFEKFLKNDLRVSKDEYSTLTDLENARLSYDMYISGSDQIWNIDIVDYDNAYMLPFVKGKKKIAYAPSAGYSSKLFVKEGMEEYLDMISEYDFLSVREKPLAEDLCKITGKNVFHAVDPTLLLPSSEWDKLAGDLPIIKEKYVYGYSPFRCDAESNTTESIAKKLGCIPLHSIPFYYKSDWKTWPTIKFYNQTGPKEFLNLIKFSEFMVCQSFHAVVFSLIFGKPFVCIGSQNDYRIENILDICGLQHLNLPSINNIDIQQIIKNTNYNLSTLNHNINSSLTWLQTALES